jgi:hypothetical protein
VKVICPFHAEDTPSCQVYADGFHCFGCGARGPLAQLDGRVKLEYVPKEREPEDMAPMWEYVNSLPVRQVRGVFVPADAEGYFICWPNRAYYKKRFFAPRGPKYIGPSGHQPPLFWATYPGPAAALVIVEGELNALSIGQVCPRLAVCSPGGAGNFTAAHLKKFGLHSTVEYSKLLVVADNDVAGAEAVINARGFFASHGRDAAWLLMSPDANDVLVNNGPDELRKQICRALGEDVETGAQDPQVPV